MNIARGKYHIWTVGCQMNQADSQRVATILEGLGWEEVPSMDQANLVILNTCSVRAAPEQRAHGQLSLLGHAKKKRADLLVGMMGCMIGNQKTVENLKQRYPMVDLFFKVEHADVLPQFGEGALLKDQDPVAGLGEPPGEVAAAGAGPHHHDVGSERGCHLGLLPRDPLARRLSRSTRAGRPLPSRSGVLPVCAGEHVQYITWQAGVQNLVGRATIGTGPRSRGFSVLDHNKKFRFRPCRSRLQSRRGARPCAPTQDYISSKTTVAQYYYLTTMIIKDTGDGT